MYISLQADSLNIFVQTACSASIMMKEIFKLWNLYTYSSQGAVSDISLTKN